ncbi:MAG: electron transfer flavoprotein subunit beta/FixA family protein [Phycisphaerae bacterium]|nr:electron transfer flavoprotein subunit beta/FixA family protein [Phycisphaerae bacterium]
MGYRCVVLIKQVPDTKKVTGKTMNDDGTVNRAALPAIFNPEDLNALELALRVRAQYGGTVTVITMGPPGACEALRDALCRGADRAILVTDRRGAGSDTLATSHILSCAVKHQGQYDLVVCGRQAIDGDTAQVGPQCAEKLGIPQVTYVEADVQLNNRTIRARRNLGNGWELLEGPLPVLLTVTGEANTPRPQAARRTMKYKRARSPIEIEREVAEAMPDASDEDKLKAAVKRCDELKAAGLLIDQFNLDDIGADFDWVGLRGSPTWVNRVQTIVLTGSGYKKVESTEAAITAMVHELIEDHTIG